MLNRLSNTEIRSSLLVYGIRATDDLCDQIRTYIDVLLRWNRKISLTSVTIPAEIVRFHFGESLFATTVVRIAESRLADVGSGAGFPGLAIHLLDPASEVVLIESNAKKATFLSEVSRELNLEKVQVFRGRMEEFHRVVPEMNAVSARALGQHDELLAWSHSLLKPAGRLILWLGEQDVLEVTKNQSWLWMKPVNIPASKRRFVLVGSPIK
jgi:16S rRNA (guanine(527)-N(7))-methyltransferase RsmG